MSRFFEKYEIFAGTYQIIREIGRGGVGVVYLAYHLRLRKNVVVKRIHTRFAYEQAMRDEADILKNLHHPYLPQIYDYIVDGDEVYTVMDYVEGTSFAELSCGIANISEQQMLTWMRQLAEVLDYLHSQTPPIIHSDIKPGNMILRPDGSICLIDFNISLAENAQCHIKGFSEYYASPEQIQLADIAGQGQLLPYSLDVRSDIYSFGATFYWLCSGITPNGRQQMYKLSKIQGIGYSQPLMSILDKCMSWNRKERYARADKLCKALSDLKKADRRYLYYVRLRACSIILSAILAAGGMFLILHGAQEQKLIDYREEYSSFVTAYENGENALAERIGLSLLNDSRFQSVLNNQTEDRAMILHTLGDIATENENDSEALNYYSESLNAAKVSDIVLDAYYRDYAIALVSAGNTDRAQEVLNRSRMDGVSEYSIMLVQAALYMRNDEYDACIESVSKVITTSTAAQLCLSACELASDAMLQKNDYISAAQWLEKGLVYKLDTKCARKLAEMYLSMAENASSDSAAANYGRKAIAVYQKLISVGNISFNDYINCSGAYVSCGNAQNAIQLLFECQAKYDKSFYISANLALAYYKTGDVNNAFTYCKQAVYEYGLLSADEQSRAAVEYQNICELNELMQNLR